MSRNRLAPIPSHIVQKNTRSSGGYVIFLEEGNTLPPKPTTQVPITPSPDSVTIGTQVWISANFDGITYLNGDPITFAANASEWNTLSGAQVGAWCYYDFDNANAIFGKLYNWYAATDPRGIGYEGFHLATLNDWSTLQTYVSNNALPLMKEGNLYWNNDNGTNIYRFNAIGNGTIDESGTSETLKDISWIWTSNEDGDTNAILYYIVNDGFIDVYSLNKGYGMALRFVQD